MTGPSRGPAARGAPDGRLGGYRPDSIQGCAESDQRHGGPIDPAERPRRGSGGENWRDAAARRVGHGRGIARNFAPRRDAGDGVPSRAATLRGGGGGGIRRRSRPLKSNRSAFPSLRKMLKSCRNVADLQPHRAAGEGVRPVAGRTAGADLRRRVDGRVGAPSLRPRPCRRADPRVAAVPRSRCRDGFARQYPFGKADSRATF